MRNSIDGDNVWPSCARSREYWRTTPTTAQDRAVLLRQIWRNGTTTLAYDPNGRLEATTLPNGATTTATYDRSGRPTRMTHVAGGATVGDYQYTYDATGRRVQAVENVLDLNATLMQPPARRAHRAYSTILHGVAMVQFQ